jgi:lipopolysaccharide export system permease protein
MTWKAVLNPDLVKIVDIRPENLSSLGLYKYIQYLKDNNRRSAEQELAFWKRLSYPLVSTVMVLLAIPFVFGSSRSVTIGQRILVGALWGIGFFMLNQIVTNFGLVYNISPILSAFLPPLLFLGFTLFLLKRVV